MPARAATPTRKGSQSPSSSSSRAVSTKNKYSVLLPTYNERENLPLITAMLDKAFVDKCVAGQGAPVQKAAKRHDTSFSHRAPTQFFVMTRTRYI
jgi:hypothetical protein